MTQLDVMFHALRHVFYADKSNAAIHCAEVRFSPLTFRLAELLDQHGWSATEVDEVMAAKGSYQEDPGR